ncbi:conserved exported hypothetical protein [Burkholderia sp. 8Y]|uniref:hypothetical protein n=1 Tax=Burkholderia sp. 8Y TaxID=2653133 RepID=UPI0012F16894|nr:hypothetical protein [Burkholderia sp. 8Y]VXC78539.1 conserved exported hypothetical protein [Burkholderia sp. 8Y]
MTTLRRRCLFLRVAAPMLAICTVQAQTIPKQGSIDATFTAFWRDIKEAGVGSDESVYLTEAAMIFTSNNKNPLMHNVTAQCIESGFSAGPANGYCVFTDKDGDNFVESFNHAAGATSGKAVMLFGTGKYKGIRGDSDWQQVSKLPGDKGAYNFVGKTTGSYRIE